MGTGTPFDFTILNATADNESDIVRKLEDAVDPKLLKKILKDLSGTPASVVCSTLCTALSTVIANISKDASEFTACEIHNVMARFSHAVLHAIIRVEYDLGTRTGERDMDTQHEPVTKH